MEKFGEYMIKVEEGIAAKDGRPSYGPVYRSVYAADGLASAPPGIDSCWAMFCQSVKRNPDNRMLGQWKFDNEKAGEYVWSTYKEVYDKTIQIGSALRCSGLQSEGACGIYAKNCAEWVITLEACNSQGILCIPLYDTLGANAVEFIICHAEVSVIFVEESKVSNVLKCFPACKKFVKTLVYLTNITHEEKELAEQFELNVHSWGEFLEMGKNTPIEPSPSKKDDVCTIMYTSGTTGEPKGVVLTNENFLAEISAVDEMFCKTDGQMTESDTYMSYLPLAHIFEFCFVQHMIYVGASVGFWRGDSRLLLDDMMMIKPTIFVGVPRVFDRIYTGINQKISAGGTLRKKLFDFAYNYKLKNMQNGLKHQLAAPIFDKLIFSKVKESLGGQTRFIISGGAPLASNIDEFFRVTSCSCFVQGYGLTETCSGVISGLNNVFSMVGTVGVPNTCSEVRLRSVPEKGYEALSEMAAGEICIRGKNVFREYYKRGDLTVEAIENGWLLTGDIGQWLPHGVLKIIDRKKNIFKLSQGEYIAVEKLEDIYNHCSAIDMIWVYGNSFESFLVAVVVPNHRTLESWAASNGEKQDFSSLCRSPMANHFILEKLKVTGKEYKVKGFEEIKAIHLESKPFDVERGLITPTYKLKRSELLKYYQNAIDDLYRISKLT